MLGYKPKKTKLRAIKTSNTGIMGVGTLRLLIPTKTHNSDELQNLLDQLTTKITIVYADLTGMSDEEFPFANLLVIPFYANSLFAKPEYNRGSNTYFANILDLDCTGDFVVDTDEDDEYNLYFKITLGS